MCAKSTGFSGFRLNGAINNKQSSVTHFESGMGQTTESCQICLQKIC